MMLRLIRSSLTTDVSPMVYVTLAVSTIVGLCFFLLSGMPDVQHSLLVHYGIPLIGYRGWGASLMFSGLVSCIGLAIKRDSWVEAGSMVGFVTWCFAAIVYGMNGFWFAFATYAVFHVLFQGYVFLATSLGFIRRLPVDID